MKQPCQEPELYEACRTLITETRRARVDLDEAWGAHVAARSRISGYCLSLLDEASARLTAREQVRVERAHRAIEDIF